MTDTVWKDLTLYRDDITEDLEEEMSRQIVERACMLIGHVLGREYGDWALNQVVEALQHGVPVSMDSFIPGHEWKRVHRGKVRDLQTVASLRELRKYGYEGILPRAVENGDDLHQWFEACFADGKSVVDNLPPHLYATAALRNILHQASARYRLDSRETLDIHEVARLGDVSVKTVRNAMSAGEIIPFGPRTTTEIVAADALRWLEGRDGFVMTRMQNGHALHDANETEQNISDLVFVPVTDDGVAFMPKECRTDTGEYKIADQTGRTSYYEDYWDALWALTNMQQPKFWRTGSDTGLPGIKKVVAWTRLPKSSIEECLASSEEWNIL